MTGILTHFHKQDRRKRIILLLAVYTLVFAFLMPDRHMLVEQYLALLLHQTYLIQDAFVTAGFAATFFNVALHFFVAYYLMSRNERSKISGLQIAAIGIFIGHSFFGTHILNIIPILVGTVLYAHWTHQSFKLFTTVSLFATATAPLVSFVALEPGLSIGSVLAACLVGILLGFIAPPLAEHYLKFHNGLSLYNYGFTTGYMAMFFVLALPYLGWETQLTINLLQTNSHILLTYFSIIWAGFAFLVVKNFREAIQHYPKLLRSSGRLPDDFVAKYGIYSTLLNMCCNSGLYLLIILLLGEPLNGPVLGALLSFFGFSAFGKHTKNCLPVTLGIMAACLLLGQPLTGIRFQLAFFLGNGLAPISGFYGMTYGFVAGFLHYNLTSLAFGLHQGMSLYNNGFTTGLVAGFLFPIIENIQDHKPKWTQLHWRKNVKRKK